MSIHSKVGFYLGEKTVQKATDKLPCLNLPKKRKLNQKGETMLKDTMVNSKNKARHGSVPQWTKNMKES